MTIVQLHVGNFLSRQHATVQNIMRNLSLYLQWRSTLACIQLRDGLLANIDVTRSDEPNTGITAPKLRQWRWNSFILARLHQTQNTTTAPAHLAHGLYTNTSLSFITMHKTHFSERRVVIGAAFVKCLWLLVITIKIAKRWNKTKARKRKMWQEPKQNPRKTITSLPYFLL